jgi:hypothetical protein
MTIDWITPASAPATWVNVGFGMSLSTTFTGLNGGTPYPAGAFAVVFLGFARNDLGPLASVTVGGLAATLFLKMHQFRVSGPLKLCEGCRCEQGFVER